MNLQVEMVGDQDNLLARLRSQAWAHTARCLPFESELPSIVRTCNICSNVFGEYTSWKMLVSISPRFGIEACLIIGVATRSVAPPVIMSDGLCGRSIGASLVTARVAVI